MRNNLFMGVAAIALVAPAGVMAQETTSQIRGSVTSAGAPVAGATIVATNVPSGTRSTATSDANGAFNLNGLRPGGPYTVEVTSASGNTTVTDIQTVTTQVYELPIDLDAANTAADIVVTASSIRGAGSKSQGPVTVLTSAQIAQVATINRDIRDLERRDPFARLDDTPTGGRAVSFAGQNARYNSFSVDGVAITDNFGLNTDGLPSRRSPIPLDAIGQFQAKVASTDVRDGNFQGGLVNVVLRSGTNDFQGTGFYARQTDGLSGNRTKDITVNLPKYGQDNYGAELSGPIIKDKLFFMVAGERIRGAFPLVEGTADNNAGTIIPNITTAQVNQVVAIAQSKYGYNAGGVLTDSGDKDDRIVAKIDWNISDRQRFALTGTYAKDQININSSNTFVTGTPGLGLSSNAYISGNRLYTIVGQLNSDWTDSFSTEVRGFYKNYVRLAQPLLGNNFAQFRICDAATSDRTAAGNVATSTTQATSCAAGNGVISIGPDNSRQTNQLNSHTWGGLAQGRLTMDGHDLRVFASVQDTKIFNSFVQNSAGNYYFDSIADFQAGNAQQLTYSNAVPSDNPNDAAARFSYQAYTFGVQDSWRISDMLTVNYGARYDLYGGHSTPAFSPSFTNRYANGATVMGQNTIIGPNTQFINGLGLFQPRGGFDFKPVKNLSFRGSGGFFSGGTPDVYVSNSFSNTGILTNTVTIRQQNNGVYTGVDTQVTGAAALQNVTGTAIPGAVNTYLNSAAVSGTAVTNALARNFKIPSQFRSTLSADYKFDAVGGTWTVGADGFYSKVRNQVYFTDIRSTPIAGSLTPDGRQRYTGLTSFGDTNSDIFLTNTSKGRSYVAVGRFDASWDFGLSAFGSFTYQDVKDQAPATSSTASSNYANGAFIDPNNVAYGISNDQVKYFYKYGATFDHAFFRDYKTTIALFGETRIGHPYSYTFLDPSSGRSPIFGTIGSGSRYLLYVPTFGTDAKVSYDTAAHQQQIEQYFQSVGLGKYQGQTSLRNVFHSPWFTKLDLHLSQELPTFVGKSRITVFADIENFTNLLNRKWGQISEYVFNYNVAPVRVQCLTTAVATGTAPTTAQQVTTTAQPCAQYRYTPAVTNADGTFQSPALTVYARQSLYSIRLGARFSF